eukprot:193508_1
MSGNEFINFAIWLKNDNVNITSCVKKDIIDYMRMDDCYSYGTFGPIYKYESISYFNPNHDAANIFNIHSNKVNSIIRADNGACIALENNQINIYQNNTNILNMIHSNYLLIDTAIDYTNASNDQEANIRINTDNCNVHCYSQTHRGLFISVLHVTCPYDVGNSSSYIDSVYEAKNDSLSPHFIDISPLNGSGYVPGQSLKLTYSVYDRNYKAIKNKLIGIPLTLTFESSDELVPNFQLIIDTNTTCPQCVDAITLPSVTLDEVGNSYSFNASVSDNALIAIDALNVIITNCPMGYGSTRTKICDVCNRGFFNVFAMNTSNECYYCDENALEGVSCPGSAYVIIQHDYWASIYQYSEVSEFVFGADTDQYIVSYKCLPLFCCQLEEGCSLVDDTDYLCANNRDFEAPLCGECKDGYSELFGTNNCGKCARTHWERLLIPLMYGLLWILFILLSKSSELQDELELEDELVEELGTCDAVLSVLKKCCCKCQSNGKKHDMSRDAYLDCLQAMVTKIILYYYQGISYILTTSRIQHALYGFVELFNMNILMVISPSNNDGYCLLQDMNAIQKITLPLLPTSVMVFTIITLFLLSKRSIDLCCCFKRRRQLHFGKSIVSVMLICVGQVLSVLFKLLSCRDIGNLRVHYFFGAYECPDMIWSASFVCLLIVFAAFTTLFVWIWCKKSDSDASDQMAYYPAINHYRPEIWFWECILFIRRSILALAFIVFDSDELKVSIGIGLLIFLLIHMHCQPFKWPFENQLETYLILSTVICIFIDTTYSSDTNSTFSNVCIALLIIFPLVWYFMFMLLHCEALADDHDAEKVADTKRNNTELFNRKRTLSASERDTSGTEDESYFDEQKQEDDVDVVVSVKKHGIKYTSIPMDNTGIIQ